MFDTFVTVVGNVLHEPEQRQTSNTGVTLTTFKIASTARRLDRQSGKWIDGNSVRVRVTCWRALAANVKQSVRVGDPVIVYGRLFTRDWEDEDGNRRLAYELEAMAVGHDLSRGRAVFERGKPRTSTSATEDDHEVRVGGEPTEPVPDSEAVQFDDTPFEAVFDQPAIASPSGHDPDGGGLVDGYGNLGLDGVGPGNDAGTASSGPGRDLGSGGEPTPVGDRVPVGDPEPDSDQGEVAPGRRRGGRRARVSA
jgi:single-strand DNA-binding protein